MNNPTEKQKTIAEQSVYGDLQVAILVESSQGGVYCEFESNFLDKYGSARDNYESRKPVLRPLDLTKEITHAGYNDDKPFIPLVELAKMSMQDAIRKEYYKPEQFILKGNEVVLCDYVFSYEKRECFSWYHRLEPFRENTCLYQQSIYDLLRFLHFDTRNLIDKGEAIDVNTLDINPYSVKL